MGRIRKLIGTTGIHSGKTAWLRRDSLPSCLILQDGCAGCRGATPFERCRGVPRAALATYPRPRHDR